MPATPVIPLENTGGETRRLFPLQACPDCYARHRSPANTQPGNESMASQQRSSKGAKPVPRKKSKATVRVKAPASLARSPRPAVALPPFPIVGLGASAGGLEDDILPVERLPHNPSFADFNWSIFFLASDPKRCS